VNSWKVILATMVIFGAGVVTGGLLVRQTQFRWVRNGRPPQPQLPQPPFPLIQGSLRRMQQELNLTPDQHERIEKILRGRQEEGRKLMQETIGKIRAELAQEQEVRFDQLLKQQQQQQQRPRRPEGFQPQNHPDDQGSPPQQHDRPPGELPPPNQPPPAEL
jgi:hypothetical protein